MTPVSVAPLTEVHAVLVVALQKTQQQIPQVTGGLSGDAGWGDKSHHECMMVLHTSFLL